jgi:hypothetical protein
VAAGIWCAYWRAPGPCGIIRGPPARSLKLSAGAG